VQRPTDCQESGLIQRNIENKDYYATAVVRQYMYICPVTKKDKLQIEKVHTKIIPELR